MRKHTGFATALATTVAVSLSVFGLAATASATETADMPYIEFAHFSAGCFDMDPFDNLPPDNLPGAQGEVDVFVPEGSDPVEVSVEYGGGQVLFGGTLTETGMVTGGGALPLGDYDLTILLNGTPRGSGLVSAVSCEEVANPGGETDNDGGSTDDPAPVATTDPVVVQEQLTVPAPVKSVAPVVKAPIANAVPKGNTDGYDMQSASNESSFGVGTAGIAVSALLFGLLALVGWRRKTLAGK